MSILRQLDINDWQSYKALRLECLKNTPWAFGARYTDEINKSDDYWQSIIANPQRIIFGIFKDEILIAMAGLFSPEIKPSKYAVSSPIISKTNIQTTPNNTHMIVSVYCTPKFRGNGYINQLLRHLIDKLHIIHNGNLSLAVEKNNLPAISLYQKLGFIYDSELPPRMMGDGNMHDEILMRLIK